jgi:hypothetical protein
LQFAQYRTAIAQPKESGPVGRDAAHRQPARKLDPAFARAAPARLTPKTSAFPSYTKIIFGPADRPKPRKCSPEIRKKRHRVDDDFAVAFVPLESESARTRQQFLQALLKDSISKNTESLCKTMRNPRTHPEAQSGRSHD